MHYFWWYMSSFIKSKMLSQFLVDHMTIQAFSRHTSISQSPQHTVVQVLSSPPCQQVSAMRTKAQNELSAQALASSWLFWPNGQAGRVLSHMNCNYTSTHTWNPSSSGRKVEAWTQWQWCDVCSAVVTSSCKFIYSFIVQNDPSSAVVVGRFFHCNTHANSICYSTIGSPRKTTGVLQLSDVLQYRSFCPDIGRSPTDFQVHALLVFWYGYYLSKRTWQTA